MKQKDASKLNDGMSWRSGEKAASWKRNPLRYVSDVDTTCGWEKLPQREQWEGTRDAVIHTCFLFSCTTSKASAYGYCQ